MITSAQLSAQLDQLGIKRSERALTDWRHKGLLPRLRHRGLGRGKGSEYFWDEDVLDQAIAAYWLMWSHSRADDALLGLWLCGFSIDPAAAKVAWVEQLRRDRIRKESIATRYKDGMFGLGRSWSRQLDTPRPIETILASTSADIIEWQYDDVASDDDAIQNLIAEIVCRVEVAAKVEWDRREVPRQDVKELAVFPSKGLLELCRRIWVELDIPTLFRNSQSLEFVQSMSVAEMDGVHKSLAAIRRAVARALRLFGDDLGQSSSVLGQVKIMDGIVGPLFVKLAISLNRRFPQLPIDTSISTLHDVIIRVKSKDLEKKSDGTFRFSRRVSNEWKTVKAKLIQLWNFDPKDSPT